MTYFGKDLSKYQDEGQVTPDFVILNVEDPYIGAKVDAAYARGIRWDIYKWAYPNTSGLALFNRAKQLVDALYRGGRYPQFWLDYEEGGVAPWQIDEWYLACNNASVPGGLYIYLYLMNAQGVEFTRDGWLAYYPSSSGDYWPAQSDTARSKGAKLHQYSSNPVDKNVVLDDPWYEGSTPLPPLPPLPPEGDDMLKPTYIEKKSQPELGLWVCGDLYGSDRDNHTKRHVTIGEFDWLHFLGVDLTPLKLDDEWWDSIPTVTP